MSDLSFPLNQHVLSTDADHIAIKGINAHEHVTDQPNVPIARKEHAALIAAYKQMGITVEQIPSPPGCQDGVFTANWGLTWTGRCLMSRLPNLRQAEEPYAKTALEKLGFETKQASVLFSGQGDAMIIGGNRVLIGNGYRTNPAVADEIRDWLGLEAVIVRTKPKRTWYGAPVKNGVTGLWDSYYYDLDLAVAVIRPDLIGVCFDALTREGKAAIQSLTDIEIFPVDLHEARYSFACNLVSTGSAVVMVDDAPKLAADLEGYGIKTIQVSNHEIKKGGGGWRCSSLSLYK